MNSRLRELIRAGCAPELLHWAACPQGKSGGSPPPAPDYKANAEQTAAANREMATANTWANRPNQNTPWGSTFWTNEAQIDPATGQQVTSWTQNQSLDPALQNALNEQLGIMSGKSQLAGSFMGRVAQDFSKPFDWQNLPGMAATPQQQFTQGRDAYYERPQGANAFSADRQRIEQGLFDRMRPEHQAQQEALQAQLANQGLTPGSPGYAGEMQRLSDQQERARFNAMEMGGSEQARMQQMNIGQQDAYNRAMNQMFTQDMGANAQNWGQMLQASEYQNNLRKQGIAEQSMARNMSLNELNALMSEQQVHNPQMPGFQSATGYRSADYSGAASDQYGAGVDAYNASQANAQSGNSALYGLGGAALTAAAVF
jgi:hypothetical protein